MTKTSNPRNRLLVLIGIALIFSACSDIGGPADQSEVLELAVRMHLVQSDHLDELNVGLSDAEVSKLMTAVNEAWAPAGIVWTLESIIREEARNESLFRLALTDPTVSPVFVITDVLRPDNLRPGIWNVFMIRDFGGVVGGVYLGFEKVVVSTEIDPGGQRDIEGGMARILAHELGHSLSLAHVPCVGPGNLMAAGCTLGSRTFLDPTQIAGVRQQAEIGRPF